MNRKLSPTHREGESNRDRTTRRRFLLVCGAGGILGMAGCTGDDDDEPTDEDDDNATDDPDDGEPADDGDEQPDRTEPASFAFDVEHRSWEDGGWDTSTYSGYVAANGDFYTISDVDDEEHWGIWEEDLIYVGRVGEDCYRYTMGMVEPYPFVLSGFDTWFNIIRLTGTRGDSGTTTIDGHDVTFQEYTALEDVFGPPADTDEDIQITATEYISIETGYRVGFDLGRRDDGEPTLEHSTRYHSFDEEFTVTPPSEC